MNLLRIMWACVRRDAKIAFSYRLQFLLNVAGLFSVCVTLFFASLMLRQVEGDISSLQRYGGSYFAFVIVGIAVSSYVDTSLRTFSISIRTAQMTGTFEAMLLTPAPLGAIVAGSAMYALANSLLRSVILVGIGSGVFGVQFHGDPALLIVFVLTVSATLALGIFSAGFIVLFKQGDPLTSAISGLSWLLSGVLYPKEILPRAVQRVADLLPVTHALEAARRSLLVGAPLSELTHSIAGLAAFSAAGIPLSLVWFGWAVKRARIAGSLARY